MKYEIYQIEDIENCNYAFMNWRFAKPRFNFNDYKKVYEKDIIVDDIYETLEYLFNIFNTVRMFDYKGRSMSVSDIVKLGDKYYYVDSVGFKEIEV